MYIGVVLKTFRVYIRSGASAVNTLNLLDYLFSFGKKRLKYVLSGLNVRRN